MRTTLLISAALVAASTLANAQIVRSPQARAPEPSGFEFFARAPAWTAHADNVRPSYARRVNANGQGTN